MRNAIITPVCLATLFLIVAEIACAADSFFIPGEIRSYPVSGQAIETRRIITPSTYVVRQPTIVSESLPIRISPPIRETVLSYEMPVVTSISNNVVTTISDSSEAFVPAPRTVRMIESHRPLSAEMRIEPMRTELVPLLEPTPVTELSSTEPIVEVPKENDERTVVLKPPFAPIEPGDILPREETVDVPKKATVPPPTPRYLGQSTSNFANELNDILSTPPPLPQGPVNPEAIDAKLVPAALPEAVLPPADSTLPSTETKPVPPERKPASPKSVESRINGVLLVATIVSIMLLIYMTILAIDYYQRWMQSLTAQNNRFSGILGDESLDSLDGPDYFGGLSYTGGVDAGRLPRFGSEFYESSSRYAGY